MSITINAKGTSVTSFRIGSASDNPFTLDASGLTTARTWTLPDSNGTNTYLLSTNGAGVLSWAAPATGTVTAVSVASSNGFTGSSSGGATPILTLATSISGVLLGNGTAISASNVTNDAQVKLSTFTTAGDVIYGTGAGTVTRLGVGTDGAMLTLASGVPTWAAILGGAALNFIPYGSGVAGSGILSSSEFTWTPGTRTLNIGGANAAAITGTTGSGSISLRGRSNSGTGGALNLQGGDSTGGNTGNVILRTEAPGTATASSGTLQITTGAGNTSGTGGALTITAGAGGTTATTGGTVTIRGGKRFAGTTGSNDNVIIQGADSGVSGSKGEQATLKGGGGLAGPGGIAEVIGGIGGAGATGTGGTAKVTGGVADTLGAGGPIAILASNAGATSGLAGGLIGITAGNGNAAGAGGAVNITAGTAGSTAGAAAGNVNVTGGTGANTAAAGTVAISGGTAFTTGAGGPVTVTGSNAGATSGLAGGAITVTTGDGNNTGAGGLLSLIAGNGGTGISAGGAITLTAGTSGSTGIAGAITLNSGISAAGTGGALIIQTGNAALVERLRITSLGEWQLANSGGTATQVLTSNGASTPPTWSNVLVSGTATIDFGSYPGANEATVAVTGLTTIRSTSIVTLAIMADATSVDHTASDHQYFTTFANLTNNTPTAGVGFTIYSTSTQQMQGKWTVQYSWANSN